MGAQTSHIWCQPLVGHAESLAISALEVDACPQVRLDPLDVQRVDRQPRSFSFRDRDMTPRLS